MFKVRPFAMESLMSIVKTLIKIIKKNGEKLLFCSQNEIRYDLVVNTLQNARKQKISEMAIDIDDSKQLFRTQKELATIQNMNPDIQNKFTITPF